MADLDSELPLNPEERLALECASPPELLDSERLREMASQVTDWAFMTETVLRMKLAPLVYERLTESKLSELLPSAFYRRLGAAHMVSAGANERLLAERDRLLTYFYESVGVTVLPLKGCAFADTLYADPSLRPMGDLDLLIPSSEMDQVAQTLTEMGYQTEGIEARGETFFYRETEQLFVDAHTEIDPSGRFDLRAADLWADAAPLPPEPRSKGDQRITARSRWKTLSVQHHFIHAVLHAVRHRFLGLGPLVDAAWLAARWTGEIGWGELPELARRWRCREALGFGLYAGRLLFRLPVPEETLSALAPSSWRSALLKRLWLRNSPLDPVDARAPWERFAFSALTTTFPGGFFGALRRFGRTRPVPPAQSESRERS